MREFQEKKRFRKYLYSKVAVVILIILVAFFSRAAWGVYLKEQASSANALRSASELKKLEDRQEVLNGEIGSLSTDEGVEEAIRAKYGVSKPGEQMIVIVDQGQASDTPTQMPDSWWVKFKKFFK